MQNGWRHDRIVVLLRGDLRKTPGIHEASHRFFLAGNYADI
jgi:hypothetical protein